jgi:hypothetical protein
MASNLERRLSKFEEKRGRPGDYLTVVVRRFSEIPPPDPSPKWNDGTRVLVLYEGYEHLGDEPLREHL